MSTNPTGAVVTHDRSAVGADAPQTAADQSSELAGIAAAIERVDALLATTGPEPGDSDAIERIADIAFVLHEREVEASLCDALDAAVRELSKADMAKQTNVQHVRQAAELLRDLSARVSDMIALLQVSRTTGANDTAAVAVADVTVEQDEPALAEPQARADTLDADMPPDGLFTAETLENDEFTHAVADLAASLPNLAASVEAVVVAPHECGDPAPDELTLAPEPEEAAVAAHEEAIELAASADELASEQPAFSSELEDATGGTMAETQRDCAELPANWPAGEPPPPAMHNAPVSEQALSQESSNAEAIEEPMAREGESSAPSPPAEVPTHDAVSDAVLASENAVSGTLFEETLSCGAEPSQPMLPELALVDPQDDPGDLFEPLTGAAPPIAAATLAGSLSASEIPARAAAVPGRSSAAATDPLAAMRTLGTEELLALFT